MYQAVASRQVTQLITKTTVFFDCQSGNHKDCAIVLITSNGTRVVCICKCHYKKERGIAS